MEGKKLLVAMAENNKNVYLSARNLQKTQVMEAREINTYRILDADVLVVTEKSLEIIDGILNK